MGVTDAARRLLALRNIDDDKTTKKQLSEEQLKDLAGRLKEAEARLPGALAGAYRHVLVPAEKKTVRCFDMGMASFSTRTTLSNKVHEKLVDEGQPLEKLDPAILIGAVTTDGILVNPREGKLHTFSDGDQAVVISYERPESLL